MEGSMSYQTTAERNPGRRILHSAIGYIVPTDKLEGREDSIFAERNLKLKAAKERRKSLKIL